MKAAASYRFRVLFCRISRSHMRWLAGHAQWRCFRMLFAPWNYIVPRPSLRLPYIHLNIIRTSLWGFMAMCIRTWSILNNSAWRPPLSPPQAGGTYSCGNLCIRKRFYIPASGGGMQLRIFIHSKEILPPACGGARGGLEFLPFGVRWARFFSCHRTAYCLYTTCTAAPSGTPSSSSTLLGKEPCPSVKARL